MAVVSLMAPMWNTISSGGLVSRKASNCSGAMIRPGGCAATFRHFWPVPSQSATTVWQPLACRAACRLLPMKPAPPVTRIMPGL